MRDCHMCGAFEAARRLVYVNFYGIRSEAWCCDECYRKLTSGELWSTEVEQL